MGGTSGIGRACVEQFLEQGCSVVAVGKGSAHVTALIEEVGACAQLTVLRADCSTRVGCDEVVRAVGERFGHLDVLVNAFGVLRLGGVAETDAEDWDLVMHTNVSGVFHMTQAAIPLLERSSTGPTIVNISSSCTARPCPSASYTVSKAAVEMFTTCAARDLAPKGIRVNAVAPGLTESNMQIAAGAFADSVERDAFLQEKREEFPLGRTGVAQDTANAVAFLASAQSSWTTGAILRVDGGISSTGGWR